MTSVSTTTTENAKKVISQLLTTANSPGSYCCGGEIPAECGVPKITLIGEEQDEDESLPRGVYHLTAQPIQPRPRQFNHLPAPSPSPPQPALEGVALRIAVEMDRFVNEPSTNYPCSYLYGEDEAKPVKLVLVLSHHYTPAALSTGMAALKGSDRAIAELIRGAAWIRPDGDHQGRSNSLQRLAAQTLLEQNPTNYQATPSNHVVHEYIKDEYKGDCASGADNEGPYFDAYLALATLYDEGEMSYGDEYGFRTTGQLISLTNPGSQPPFDMGPALANDLEPEYHPSWFGADANSFAIYDFDRAPAGNHSLPLYNHELLFASAQAMETHLSEQSSAMCQNEGHKVEFLGNGMPYPGRVYSRAVIVMWPRAHRTAVQEQTKGGSTVLGSSKPTAQE